MVQNRLVHKILPDGYRVGCHKVEKGYYKDWKRLVFYHQKCWDEMPVGQRPPDSGLFPRLNWDEKAGQKCGMCTLRNLLSQVFPDIL
jgi:hypothetical protein